jgi:taurine dioxygenase
MNVSITPLSNTFGAAISGLDLSGDIDAETIDFLNRAFLQYHVIAIRAQQLSVQQTVRLSQCFGELEPHVLDRYHHPETPLIIVLSNRVDADNKPLGLRDAGSFWHSDVSFKERPAKATLLYALEVPETGGDTLFCDLTAAYEAMPDAMKIRLDGLTAVHDYAQRDRVAHKTGTQPQLSEAQKKTTPPVSHPLVRTHPDTGRKAIYVNPSYTVRINELDAEAGADLLEQIYAHCLQQCFQLRYRWQPHDVLLWDNAAVMHAATTQNLDPHQYRTLWRTIIVGGRTF